MSVMGFQKKFGLGGGWVGGWGELYPSLFWNLFNFAKPLSKDVLLINVSTIPVYICVKKILNAKCLVNIS